MLHNIRIGQPTRNQTKQQGREKEERTMEKIQVITPSNVD